jgi:L-histidine Nalpha-methyltransferase / hercynylcysteine S-oxide synthase
LDAFENAKKKISYYALDLMQSELDRTLAAIPQGTFNYVNCFGLLGTYDDGLAWLKRPENVSKPKTILSMGSSIGNFPRQEAADFLSQFTSLLGSEDSLLVGLDGCLDADKVFLAYNDPQNVTYEFTLNGLKHANRLLGYGAFNLDDWSAVGEYDQDGQRHRAYVVPRRDVKVEGVTIPRGEKVRIEESYKYSQDHATRLWCAAGVLESAFWTNLNGSYGTDHTPRLSFHRQDRLHVE